MHKCPDKGATSLDHPTPGRSTPQPEQDDAEATMIAEPSPARHHRDVLTCWRTSNIRDKAVSFEDP